MRTLDWRLREGEVFCWRHRDATGSEGLAQSESYWGPRESRGLRSVYDEAKRLRSHHHGVPRYYGRGYPHARHLQSRMGTRMRLTMLGAAEFCVSGASCGQTLTVYEMEADRGVSAMFPI